MLRAALILALVCAACGHKKGDASTGGGAAASKAPATPLEAYKKQLGPLVDGEAAALGAVAAHTGASYTDDAALLAALRDTALPRYRAFADGLAKIEPPPETAKLHERLLAAAKAELSILERTEQALARGDGTAVLLVNMDQRKVRAELDGVLADYDALVAGGAKTATR
jgi:hypothetical protein